MICGSCGAEYDDNMLSCPFCGQENEAAEKLREQSMIDNMYGRIDDVMDLPDRKVKHTTLYILIIVGVLCVIAAASIIVAAFMGRTASDNEYKKRQENLAKLEEMYQNKDYEAIGKYLDSHHIYYGAAYGKYINVADLYKDYTKVKKYSADDLKSVKYASDGSRYKGCIWYLFGIINTVDKLESAGYVYGEKEEVETFRTEAVNILKNVYLLNDEEIEQGRNIKSSNIDDYSEFADKAYERMKAEVRQKN